MSRLSHSCSGPQRQLAAVGAGAVGQDLSFAHALALVHHRLLVDAGVLVRAAEFDQLVDVGADLARKLLAVAVAFHAHDDALAVHAVHGPVALADHHGARIARRHFLHACSHQRRLSAQQRHRLALHVGTHQGAVGVVVFEEGNQRRRHADQLLGADVDVVNLVAALQDEVAGLARVDQLAHDTALLVHLDVGLGDDVAVFLPGGLVK